MSVITPAGMGILAFVMAAAALRAQEVEYRLVHEEPLGGADSAVSPDGQWMAFSSRRSGNLDLWMVEVETGLLQCLTDSDSRDYEPRWHPDGTSICFTSDRERNQDIYTLILKTGEVTQQTSTTGVADYPSFSQDGSEIVFTSGPFGRDADREVHVKNLATGDIRRVTDGHRLVGSASFSPDGTKIVYHAYYESYGSRKSDVWVVDAAGGKGTNVTRTNTLWDYKPVWSYDRNWVTFSSKRGTSNFNVFVMHPDGSGLRAITNQDGPDFRWPNFTRDGRVAWHAITPQTGRIRAVDVKTGKVEDVVTSDSFIGALVPSPDGKKFVYEQGWRIYVLDPTNPGERPKRLARGREPRWSADAESITYVDPRDKFVYRIAVTGGESVRVGENGKRQSRRSKVAGEAVKRSTMVASAASPDGESRVSIVDAALLLVGGDGSSRKLADDGEKKASPVWSPDGRTIFYCQSQPAIVRYYLTEKPAIDS